MMRIDSIGVVHQLLIDVDYAEEYVKIGYGELRGGSQHVYKPESTSEELER